MKILLRANCFLAPAVLATREAEYVRIRLMSQRVHQVRQEPCIAPATERSGVTKSRDRPAYLVRVNVLEEPVLNSSLRGIVVVMAAVVVCRWEDADAIRVRGSCALLRWVLMVCFRSSRQCGTIRKASQFAGCPTRRWSCMGKDLRGTSDTPCSCASSLHPPILSDRASCAATGESYLRRRQRCC